MSQAGAYLAGAGMAVEEYLRLLKVRAAEVLAQAVPVTYPVSLAASYQLAFDQLAMQEPAALDLLTLAAHLAPEPIPFALFTKQVDKLPDRLAAAVGDPLAFAGLIQLIRRHGVAQVEAGSLHLHRVVQAILCSRLPDRADAKNTAMVAVRLLRGSAPADPWNNPATWSRWRHLLPHALAATDTSRPLDSAGEDVAWLLDRVGAYLQSLGKPALARPLYERALTEFCRMLGEDHPTTLASANNLGGDLWVLGEHELARQLLEDTLTRCRRILGADHPVTLASADNLAAALRALGEHEQARQLNEGILTRRRQILSEDHPDTLRSVSNLARALRALGDYEQARQLDDDTLTRRRQILGEDHPETLHSASNLARDLHALGEHEQACELEEHVRSRRRS